MNGPTSNVVSAVQLFEELKKYFEKILIKNVTIKLILKLQCFYGTLSHRQFYAIVMIHCYKHQIAFSHLSGHRALVKLTI